MKARFEVEDPEPVITGFNNTDHSCDGVNHDKNEKPDSLELRLWWPCETMQQVMYLYVYLVVDMPMMQC